MRGMKVFIDEEMYDRICMTLTNYEQDREDDDTISDMYDLLVDVTSRYLDGEREW